MLTTDFNDQPRETLANDILWGVAGPDGIAEFLGISRRQVYYLIERGKIPVRKHGHRIITASRAELRRVFQSEPE